MKFLVISCVIIQIVSASPFLNALLGGGSSSSSSATSNSVGSNSALPSLAGGSALGGLPPQKILGDVLGVKIALLTFLKNAVGPKEDQTSDFSSFENDGSFTDSSSGTSDFSGSGISSSGSGISSTGSQMFSENSGFTQLTGGTSISSSGSQTQTISTGQGYNYQPPVTGQGVSGGLSSGGYAYQKPAQISDSFSSSGSSSFSSQAVSSGISEYSSGSATVESNGLSSSSNGLSSSNDGFSSSSDGFSTSGSSDADFDSFDTPPSSSNGGGLGSLLQLPLKLISTKVGLVQSLLGGANRQESRRFYF